MQITSTIKKLLSQYTPEQLLRHIAYEIEEQSKHYEAVGAPMRASYGRRQAGFIRRSAKVLDLIPYKVEGIPVPKS